MSQEQILAHFPRASKSVLEANAGFTFQPEIVAPKETAKVQKLRQGRMPNKTESDFGNILEARKARGEILFYAFEGINLRWGDSMRYTTDFAIFFDCEPIKLIELKGGYRWQKDVIRYKGCKAEWKNFFQFEMWEKKNGAWTQID